MGSSAKKKKEKKKDFQKTKLKVGKAKPKPENQTDTAFRSKAIILSQQSLQVSAPSLTSQFTHHVSLLSSRSDSQRKESLAYLTTYVSSHPPNKPLPLPLGSLLVKVCPLILDGSSGVRLQLSKLLQLFPQEETGNHASKVLPFIRAGMTHLSKEIRGSAVELLSWLLNTAGDEVVSCSGGWQKTLEAFITLLGWRSLQGSNNWTSSKASFGSETKTTSRIMVVLDQLLKVGLTNAHDHDDGIQSSEHRNFPIWHIDNHVVSRKSNAFAHLSLFGITTTEDTSILEDPDDRLRVFDDCFRATITVGVDHAKQEAGELGRAAGLLMKTLKQTQAQG